VGDMDNAEWASRIKKVEKKRGREKGKR